MLLIDLFSCTLGDVKQTQAFAAFIGGFLRPGDALFLKGDMGAGKTTLAGFLIQSLLQNSSVAVSSPTFPIMQFYDTVRGPLWHVDLYRLTQEMVLDLDLEVLWSDHIMIVEWPDRLGCFCPLEALHVQIGLGPHRGERTMILQGTPCWEKRFRKEHYWKPV